jgi:hypothetical protein
VEGREEEAPIAVTTGAQLQHLPIGDYPRCNF